jgi:hypothetical protein
MKKIDSTHQSTRIVNGVCRACDHATDDCTCPVENDTNRPTLAELLESYKARLAARGLDARREWENYTLETSFAVGRNGNQRSYRGATGSHMHVLTVETVIGERGAHKPGTYKIGDAFSVRGMCASNGQNTGRVVAGIDTDSVTCSKCVAYLARMTAYLAATAK